MGAPVPREALKLSQTQGGVAAPAVSLVSEQDGVCTDQVVLLRREEPSRLPDGPTQRDMSCRRSGVPLSISDGGLCSGGFSWSNGVAGGTEVCVAGQESVFARLGEEELGRSIASSSMSVLSTMELRLVERRLLRECPKPPDLAAAMAAAPRKLRGCACRPKQTIIGRVPVSKAKPASHFGMTESNCTSITRPSIISTLPVPSNARLDMAWPELW